MKKIAIKLFLVILMTGCAAREESSTVSKDIPAHEHEFTQHYENSLFKITDNDLYSIELVIKGGALEVGPNNVDIIVHNREDKDVTEARVSVTPWMVMHGHGVPGEPEVIERGGGLYSLPALRFTMPGIWELRIKVAQNDVADTVAFSVPVKMEPEARQGAHAHKEEGFFDDIDETRTARSADYYFHVSYAADPETLPLNKIHSWTIHIEDENGSPVTGAEIEVKGYMPAHGHGFPTKPRVTQELGNGTYLVEGIKFNMPGHWIVTFSINAKGTRDNVAFHVRL